MTINNNDLNQIADQRFSLMVFCECSFLQAQKNWFCPLLFHDTRKYMARLQNTRPPQYSIRLKKAPTAVTVRSKNHLHHSNTLCVKSEAYRTKFA